VETLELLNSEPDEVFVDSRTKLTAQESGSFSRGGLSIALLPDQRRGAIEAMCLVLFRVVDKCFIIQFADYESSGSSTRQPAKTFHDKSPWLN